MQDAKTGGGRNGGRILVDCLVAQGVERVFCVPGESYLPVLDALYEARNEIDLVVCRQEGGAANMADAYGRLTGRPGICFATRGPGATNASIGVHTAFQDSTPMVLFVGQVGRSIRDREGFQEVDLKAMFAPLAKWSAEIADPRRIPEYVHRAFQTALSGRPGPVVLAVPEDVLSEVVEAAVPACRRAAPVRAGPRPPDMERLAAMLDDAERPLMIVGGGSWSAEVGADVTDFAERCGVPIAASLRCQDYVPNGHPLYVGHLGIGAEPSLAACVRESDLLIVMGARLGEMTTAGYSLIEAPRPRQRMVHIHADPEELGRVYQADLLINAGNAEMAAALKGTEVARPAGREAWATKARIAYEASLVPHATGAAVDLGRIVAMMRARLPADTIVASGAGNYTGWVHKYWPFSSYRSQLAPTSGAMGYGVPAGVAAARTCPERTVVVFAGDGCFLMNGQELATARQYGVRLIVIVVNNGSYGTIRMHQERDFPERVYGTNLMNPDFAMLARAYGLAGERVEATVDFEAALERAMASETGALIELITDPEIISVRSTISVLRSRARSGGAVSG